MLTSQKDCTCLWLTARNRACCTQDYWDFDNDGKIYPWDTYKGFYNIGFPPILAFISMYAASLLPTCC